MQKVKACMTSGRTMKKAVGTGEDDIKAPKAPRLRCRVLHGGPQPQWAGIPRPPVIPALCATSGLEMEQAQFLHTYSSGMWQQTTIQRHVIDIEGVPRAICLVDWLHVTILKVTNLWRW